VFVRFGGIDYDADDKASGKLDDFIRRAQRIFAPYGGNLLQITLGDKGAYLYAVSLVLGALRLDADDGLPALKDVDVDVRLAIWESNRRTIEPL